MRLKSVRARLIVWNVVVLALVLVLLGLVLRFTLQQTLLGGVDGRLRRMAEPIVRQVSVNGIGRGPDGMGPPPPSDSGQTSPPGPPPGDDGPPGGTGPGNESGSGYQPPGPPNDFGGPERQPSSDAGLGAVAGPGGGPDNYPPRGRTGEPDLSPDGNPPGPQDDRPRPRPRRGPPGEYPPRLLRPDGHPVGLSPGDPSGPYDRNLFKQSLAGADRFGQALYGNALMRDPIRRFNLIMRAK